MASVEGLKSKEDVPTFLETEDVRKSLFFCSKTQLGFLAEHFGIETSSTSKKGEILLKVITAMQSSESEDVKESPTQDRSVSEQVELQRLKLEMFR